MYKIRQMQHISGDNRFQYEFSNLEDCIPQDDPVRFIDAFVEKVDLKKLGFKISQVNAEGRPFFDAKKNRRSLRHSASWPGGIVRC